HAGDPKPARSYRSCRIQDFGQVPDQPQNDRENTHPPPEMCLVNFGRPQKTSASGTGSADKCEWHTWSMDDAPCAILESTGANGTTNVCSTSERSSFPVRTEGPRR